MELRHLHYFVALAEEASFSRAAERLHLAQPSLSQQIRQLERELGAVLVDRSARPVQLTRAGRRLLEDAHAVLAQLDQTARAVGRAGRGELDQLRVGYPAGGLYDLLLPALRAFRAAHPEAGLLLRPVPPGDQDRVLAGGAVDVVVSRVTRPVADAGLVVRDLRAERLVAVLPAAHPLAGAPQVALADLADEPFVMFPRRTDPVVFDRYLQACLAAGFSPRIDHEAVDAQGLALLVATGSGVALTGDGLALHLPGLVRRPLAPPVEVARIAAVWSREAPPRLLAPFVDLLARHAEGAAQR